MRRKIVLRQLRSKRSLLLKLSLLVPVALILTYLLLSFFQNSDRNFSKGVLAINTDKSIYAPGEAVLFQMASLDKNGDTLCNSNLQIEIRKTWRWKKTIVSSEQGQIQQLPTCSADNNVTNEPDYIARHMVSAPGTYRVTVKNLESGKQVQTSFEVQEQQQPVAITRSGATRINPSKSDRYPMIIRVTANQDFKGSLTEKVPKDFQFKWYGPAKVAQTEESQTLAWDIELKAGETKEFAYEYTAPPISPEFYKLGALQVRDSESQQVFAEQNQWQIASDAVDSSGNFVYANYSGTVDILNIRQYIQSSGAGSQYTSVDTSDTNGIKWTKIVASPTRDEKIAAQMNATGILKILKCTGGCDATGDWSEIGSYSALATATNALLHRPYDIAYEQLSGMFTIVFAVTTDVDDVYYCQYDGTTWSPATVCGATFAPGAGNQIDMAGVGVAGQPEWIRLVSKGSRLTGYRSDELMLGVSDSNEDLFLAHWNGSTWEDQANPTDTLSATNAQKFDIAFEETSASNPSEALAVVTNSGVANLQYVEYTGGAWGSLTTSGEANNGAQAFNSWINIANDPMTDDIAIIVNDSGADTELFRWDGSALSDEDATDDVSAEAVTGSHSVVEWSRFTSQAMFLWTDTNVTTSDMQCWQTGGGNFTAIVADVGTTNISNADDIDDVSIAGSPNNDRILATRRGAELASGTGDDLVGMVYDGAGCADGDWTTLGTLLAGGAAAGLEGGTIGNSIPKTHGFAYTPYSPWSLNWRFYDDETVDNPSTGLNGAAENVAPSNVDPEEFIRLRMNMAERGGMTQGDTRKILQFVEGSGTCTPNSVENDPDCAWTAVGDTSETSAVWRYATAGETCTSCNDGSTSNTPSLTSTTTGDPEVFYVSDKDAAADADFDHTASTVKEIDFPLKAEAVAGGATYYFRLYEPRISSNGQDSPVYREQDDDGSDDCAGGVCTYPSLTIAEQIITISGTIRQTNESSAYDCSAVTAVTVHSSTNGAVNKSADCTSSGGTYSITTATDPGAANIPVAVFIDTAEGIKGTTVTLSSAGATNITGLDIIVDRVTVTQESSTAITNAHLATADNANAGIRYAVSGGNLTVESPMELHVRTTETFAPGGNVTTDKLHIVGTYTGASETLTLLGSGTGTSRPLYVDGGTFTAPATTIFNGTSATDIEAATFNALSFTPTITGATTYTLLGAETINGNFSINPTAGTTQLLTVNAGGTITVGAAYTTTISGTTSGTSSLDLRPSSTDYNLSTGKINIAAAGTLDAGSTTATTITLNATTSTLFTLAGAFTAGGSTVIFNPDAAVTLTSGTFTSTNSFNNISLTPAISTAGRTYTFGAGAIATTGDFLIQPSGTQLLTVNMAGAISVANNKTTTISRSATATSSLVTGASNPALSTGNLTIATGGTLNGTSSSSTITLTANGTTFTRTGTYTPGSTTIAYVPANTTGVTVTAGTYNNVTFNKASNTFSLASGGITATNDLTITAGVLDTVSGSNFPITVGRNWTNSPGTGGFLAQQGTVTFNTTTTAAITGATTFYNFTAATADKTIKFGDATTFTINGLLTLTGAAGPSYVTLDSVTGGSTQWTINHQGTENITYASVKNSACDGGSTQITVTDASNFNAGNNGTCWLWPATSVNSTVWKMDEGYGDTINDAIADANDGTLTGASKPTWQTEDMCISGKCLYFEGTTAVATAALDIDAKTVSFWVRPVSTTTMILQLSSSAYIHASSGTLVAQGFSTPTIYVDGKQTSTIQANRWQHVTVTTGTTVSGTDVILGNNSSSYFKGFLDEVKFDGSEYTAAQVKGEFAKRGSIDGVSAQFGDASLGQQLSDGLVGYWKLDEMSGDASDSSGNGFSLTNNGTTTYVTGKFNRGSEHVPASSQYLSYATSAVNSYYFDASDSGPTDSSGSWDVDGGAFDGSLLSKATAGLLNGPLIAGGTNAPTSGGAISEVRGRIYGCRSPSASTINANVKNSGTSLGTPTNTIDCNADTNWGSYLSLTAPSGGWTWQKANDLTVEMSTDAIGSEVYKIEVEVTSGGIGIGSANTVSFWTNPDALTNYYVNLSSTANIQSNSSGVLSANGFTNPKIYVNGVEGTTLVANQWQLVTVTSTAAITVDDFSIGKIGSSYFDGTMDEVRLYNRTLSSAEVATIYAFAPAPIGYWKMDENTGTSIADVSGNGATLSTTNSPGFAPGKFGSALDVVGSSTQYASRTDTSALSLTSNLTLSTWIKPDAVTAATLFPITGKSTTTDISYLLAQYGDEIRVYIGSVNNFVTTNASNLSANTWYHVAAVYTASAQTVDIYINGVKAATTTTGTIPTSIADGTDDFAVGYYSSGSGGTTLSPVPEVAASTDDGYQNINGLAGDVTNTEVRVGNNSGNAAISGFRFTSIPIAQGATITSATFKPTSQDTYNCGACTLSVNVGMEDVDDATTFSATDSNISNRTATTAQTVWNLPNLSANVQYSIDVTSAVQEVVNRAGWTSGNDMAVLAIDNGSTANEWQNMYSWDHATGAPAQLTITYGSGSTSYYDGAIDDVKVYNYTRTQSQVIEDMNGNHPVGGSPIGSQVAYWKLDEGSLTTLYDSTSNGNNATLQTGSWTPSGKFGRALDFELGSTNYATLSDNAALSLTGSMTLSAWIKPESTTAATNFAIASKGTSYALTQYGDELRMYIGSEADYKTTNAVNLQTDTWYHVQGVYNAANQSVALYVNGVEYPGTVTGTIPSSISDGASAFDIGRLYTGTSYQFPITTNGDDGIETGVTGWFNNQNYDGFGYYTTVYNNTHAGLRFQDITIGQGTSISNAYIAVYGNTANSAGSATNIDADIIGDDVDSAGAWVSGSSIPSGTGMTPTSAVVAWNPSTWSNGWINSPDISSIVQEIVNRGGWASGNEMRFAIRNGSTTGLNVMAFEDMQLGNGRHAVLNISTGTSNTYYDGVIDEIKVYATALSPAQANLEYLNGKSTSIGSTSTTSTGVPDGSVARQYCVPGDSAACTSPLAEWRLDENTGTTSVADTGGTGYTGTMSGLSASSWIPGKVGSALQFNGSTTYITMATEDANFSRNNYSMSAWVYRNTDSGAAEILIDNRDAASDGQLLQIGTSDTFECYYNATASVSTTTATVGNWYHVTCTANGGTQTLYVNGIQEDSDAVSGSIAEATDLRLGARSFTSATSFFPGILDEVRLYDYALSSAQVAWNFNRGAPIAWYKMDEGADTTINDSSGNGLTGSLVLGGSPTTATAWANGASGKINRAMSFDGTDDRIEKTNDAKLNPGNNFTLAAWVKPDTTAYQQIINKQHSGGNVSPHWGVVYRMFINNGSSTFDCGAFNGTTTVTVASPANTVQTSTWQHVACTLDGSNLKIYVNGKQVGSSAFTGTVPTTDTGTLYIGARTVATTSYFDGLIDDAQIFGYSMTEQQINSLYNSGAASFR